MDSRVKGPTTSARLILQREGREVRKKQRRNFLESSYLGLVLKKTELDVGAPCYWRRY